MFEACGVLCFDCGGFAVLAFFFFVVLGSWVFFGCFGVNRSFRVFLRVLGYFGLFFEIWCFVTLSSVLSWFGHFVCFVVLWCRCCRWVDLILWV